MFSETLTTLNKGATVADLNNRMKEVVAAVRSTAKAGSLTLTIKVTPGQKGSADVVFVETDIKLKIPAEKQAPTLFFTTEDNELSRKDERQQDLDFDTPAAVPVNSITVPAGVRVVTIDAAAVSETRVKEAM